MATMTVRRLKALADAAASTASTKEELAVLMESQAKGSDATTRRAVHDYCVTLRQDATILRQALVVVLERFPSQAAMIGRE
jgi:hypothetical protein